jgi:hypothetical protein
MLTLLFSVDKFGTTTFVSSAARFVERRQTPFRKENR